MTSKIMLLEGFVNIVIMLEILPEVFLCDAEIGQGRKKGGEKLLQNKNKFLFYKKFCYMIKRYCICFNN